MDGPLRVSIGVVIDGPDIGRLCRSAQSSSSSRMPTPCAPAPSSGRHGLADRLEFDAETISLIGPIEAGAIESRVMPIAISASASTGAAGEFAAHGERHVVAPALSTMCLSARSRGSAMGS